MIDHQRAKTAFESIWLPGEEQKYQFYALDSVDRICYFLTRGKWWRFSLSAHEIGVEIVNEFAAIKKSIEDGIAPQFSPRDFEADVKRTQQLAMVRGAREQEEQQRREFEDAVRAIVIAELA